MCHILCTRWYALDCDLKDAELLLGLSNTVNGEELKQNKRILRVFLFWQYSQLVLLVVFTIKEKTIERNKIILT